MGSESIYQKVKNIIGFIGWKMFIWSINMTQEEYFEIIYQKEKLQHINYED